MCELVGWGNLCKTVIVLSIHKPTSTSAGELYCVCNVVVKCESRYAAKSFSTTLQGIGNLYFYFHLVIIDARIKVLVDVLSEEPVVLISISLPSTNSYLKSTYSSSTLLPLELNKTLLIKYDAWMSQRHCQYIQQIPYYSQLYKIFYGEIIRKLHDATIALKGRVHMSLSTFAWFLFLVRVPLHGTAQPPNSGQLYW